MLNTNFLLYTYKVLHINVLFMIDMPSLFISRFTDACTNKNCDHFCVSTYDTTTGETVGKCMCAEGSTDGAVDGTCISEYLKRVMYNSNVTVYNGIYVAYNKLFIDRLSHVVNAYIYITYNGKYITSYL